MMRVSLALLAVFLALPAYAADDGPRYRQCLETAARAPDVAINAAQVWLVERGGVPARHCLGMAQLAQGNPKQASDSFAAAATSAQQSHMPQAAALWAQAGNAALLANDAPSARRYFDTALALPAISAAERANILIDRARARHALGDNSAARADLDAALAALPDDPTALLLSATLARQSGDLVRAQKDIAHAQKIAGEDADIKAEAAAIAAAAKG